MLSMEIFINIAVNINIIPSKGMALPLISYGGSAMMSKGILFGTIILLTRKNYTFKSKYRKYY